MTAQHDRDRIVNQALKQALGPRDGAPATSACLDAETLAAWMDGGLDASSVAMAEAHASICMRCQALVGTMARTTPAMNAGREGRISLWRWWLAPLAAGAAAVTLWIVVPQENPAAPATAPLTQMAQPKSAAEADRQPPASAPPTLSDRADRADRNAASAPAEADTALKKNRDEDASRYREAKRDKAEAPLVAKANAERATPLDARSEARDAQMPAATPAPAVAAAPPVRQLRLQAVAVEIQSPDPTVRWRVGTEGVVEYTVNGGGVWERLTIDPSIQITAGSSPSRAVCWLAGRDGVVLVTTDGRTFSRVSFSAGVDLVSVQATDARTATITAADGRTFLTDDAGLSWRRQ